MQLFHTVTKSLLQEIDIEKAFLRIVSSAFLVDHQWLDSVHVMGFEAAIPVYQAL